MTYEESLKLKKKMFEIHAAMMETSDPKVEEILEKQLECLLEQYATEWLGG